MAPRNNYPVPLAGGKDRLSDLPDELLGHILSFLPNKEAGCAAGLSRRWRHIFGNVHTITLEEEEGERANDWDTFYWDAEERRSCSGNFLDDISAALLCRRRCSGLNTPLRTFHFAFDSYHRWDGVMVDQWLSYVLQHSKQELHLDLCFRLGGICERDDEDVTNTTPAHVDSDSDDVLTVLCDRWRYLLPRRLFSCVALRTLRVSYCRLKPPEVINLPHVEELRLTGISESEETIQRLISSCPRLADLTLEACNRVQGVSVVDKRLRRFSLRCCHSVVSVRIDASDLKTLDYRGDVPAGPLLTLDGSPRISSCSINFCSKKLSKKVEFVGFRKFLERFVDVKHLHLQSTRLGSSLENKFFAGFPSFSSLRRLVLQGCLLCCSIVNAVQRILEQTPNLEVFSLYLEPNNGSDGENDLSCDPFTVHDESNFSIPCLRCRVREINMVHYQGNEAQRMLAELLFRNALVLERLCVVFPKGPLALQTKLMNEIKSWAVDKSEKVFL